MRLVAILLLLTVPGPAWGWHTVGHRIIAAMAYDQLNKKTRARVDELIRKHPDYKLFSGGLTGTPAQIARWSFIHAAAWSDDIKGDARFYDDTRRDARPTAALAPFPDTKRHTNWHYVNVYFSPDNTPFPASPSPSARTELPRMIDGLAGDQGWYFLPWLLHVEGDVHQPLHCVARFTQHIVDRAGKPTSDLGGNLTNVDGYTNLHTVWDDLLGVTLDPTYIDWMAKRLRKEHKRPSTLDLDPNKWIEEGFDLAKSKAYKMTAEEGTREKPFRTTRDYWAESLKTAQDRAALAAYRLAAILNQQLK